MYGDGFFLYVVWNGASSPCTHDPMPITLVLFSTSVCDRQLPLIAHMSYFLVSNFHG